MVSESNTAVSASPAEWQPSVNPWLVAVSVMLATFMVVLDSSVANVALPHIAGTLSASTDESTWVLTSYIVANAIMLPASGWIARRIGRKRLLMLSILLFTIASLFCGLAVNMPMLIVARVLQGIGGGGMQPLAQSILLESFPPHKHGQAMAFYGMGIVVAPVIGPTLGGWITDSYSWHWIFYINLPVGLLAMFMANLFVEDPPYLRQHFKGAIDYMGFSLMALWLGTLQLVLDKGQEADWFSTSWVAWTSAISVAALIGFIARELTCAEPIVRLHVLRDRNFAVSTVITTVFGFTLYGVTALLPLFLQTLLGYPALDSGLAVSPRGLGSLVAMMIVGVLVNYIDVRLLLAFGFFGFGCSTLMLSHINLTISMWTVAIPNFINGFAGGFIFVPLTTLAMGMLPRQEIGNASGVYNLLRNVGGSVGIATVTTMLVRGAQRHQNYLAANLSPANLQAQTFAKGLGTKFLMGGSDPVTSQLKAVGMLYRNLQQQASLMAYADNFRMLGYLALACLPLVLLPKRPRHQEKPSAEMH
ncbi:DHA2 family efflux MFS transporter permease subunit [Telmatobacter bradus]|uniref:DHA2 family efflux MFS transporter permease subunit n=1 Tax=Telmatobacter bradus TaxID=474953 RepID=UPI003B4317CE